MARTTHEKLIKAGLELFHRQGIHPVGLDRILNRAGVTKTTFYNHFESKEVFACAIINRFGRELRERMELGIENPPPSQIRQHLIQVFDVWDQLTSGKGFRGCMLMSAGVGSGDPHDPVRTAAVANKKLLLESFRDIARASGFHDSKRFALRFAVIVDGALVARHLYGDGREAVEARKMAIELIDGAVDHLKNSN